MIVLLLACAPVGLDGTWWIESSSSSTGAVSCTESVTDHTFVNATQQPEEPETRSWTSEGVSGMLATIEVDGDTATLDWRGSIYHGQLNDKGARLEGAWAELYAYTSSESDWFYAQEYDYDYETLIRLVLDGDTWTAEYETSRVYVSRYTETDTWTGVMSQGYIPSDSYLERSGSPVENSATASECAGDCFLETSSECTESATLSAVRADAAASSQ